MNNYEMVIGLEVHVELNTASKIFCGCSTEFGASPNTQCCPVCLGLPGALPVLNKKVVEYAIMAGLALQCDITQKGHQDRKHYFYPDLTKAYQVSQNDQPLAQRGKLAITVEGVSKDIGITRIHIEEDAGKLIHEGAERTVIDYNRAGVPLIEIVSEPDLRSAAEVKAYLQKLQSIVMFLDISSGKMNEGALRCDVNLSVRKKGEARYGIRTETKNMNTFSAIVKAIEHESHRQIALIESGGTVKQETRRWDSDKNTSYAMRSKEDAHDYRYFQDPDLCKIVLEEKEIEAIRLKMNPLPDHYRREITSRFSLPDALSEMLVVSKPVAMFFLDCATEAKDCELLGQFIVSDVFRKMGTEGDIKLKKNQIVDLVNLVAENEIHLGLAKKAFEGLWGTDTDVKDYLDSMDLWPIKDFDQLYNMAVIVLQDQPQIVVDYRAGKTKAFGAYMGQMMKKSQGKADPDICENVFKKWISE